MAAAGSSFSFRVAHVRIWAGIGCAATGRVVGRGGGVHRRASAVAASPGGSGYPRRRWGRIWAGVIGVVAGFASGCGGGGYHRRRGPVSRGPSPCLPAAPARPWPPPCAPAKRSRGGRVVAWSNWRHGAARRRCPTTHPAARRVGGEVIGQSRRLPASICLACPSLAACVRLQVAWVEGFIDLAATLEGVRTMIPWPALLVFLDNLPAGWPTVAMALSRGLVATSFHVVTGDGAPLGASLRATAAMGKPWRLADDEQLLANSMLLRYRPGLDARLSTLNILNIPRCRQILWWFVFGCQRWIDSSSHSSSARVDSTQAPPLSRVP